MKGDFIFNDSMIEFNSSKSVDGYDLLLDIFAEFLKTKRITDETIKSYFQGVRADDLIEALDFYVTTRKVTSFGASGRFASCIKEYFIYIIDKDYIKNNELMTEFSYPTYSEKSYRYKVNNYLDGNDNIIKSEGSEMVDFETVKYLIEQCDITMGAGEVISRAYTVKKYYHKYRSALIIKLILLTGATYKTISSMSIDSLNLAHYSITINGLTVHLPNNSIEQFKTYIDIRNCIKNKTKKEKSDGFDALFLQLDGENITDKTSTTANFLKDLTGRRDLNGLIKYSIYNMIIKGINQSILMKFTGIGDTIYNWCQDEVNKSMDLKSSRYLDSKIRGLDIFDLL